MLTPVAASQERYRISLQRLDPFELAADQEPNDRPRQARAMPLSGSVQGGAATGADLDWYALPARDDGAPVVITAEGDITSLALLDGGLEQVLAAQPDGTTYTSGPLTPGQPLLLRVSPSGPYRLSLGDPDGSLAPATPEMGDLPVTAGIELGEQVAAWWPTGQRLEGALQLTNDGPAELRVALEARASDDSWRVTVPGEELTLPPGAMTAAPLEVIVPPDTPAGEPVRISLRAQAAGGGAVTAHADVELSRDVLPREQVRAWPVPDALLGGLDAASVALGAQPIPSLDPVGEARLHDGVVAPDWGLSYPVGSWPVTLTVDLAGDEPVPVAGTIIHPFAADPTLGDSAYAFELGLSNDGGSWETVLSGTLDPVAAEQSFVLPVAIPARYAQLRITAGQRDLASRLDLGEWKVVAEPGWSPAGRPLDLADARAGGHVSWMEPLPSSRELMSSPLDEGSVRQSLSTERGSSLSWAVGFMDDRAALVSSLEWQDPPGSDAASRLARVDVSASTDGPLGPWRPLGTWELQRATDGTVAPFVLEQPTWARFIRFEGSPRKRQTEIELPDRVRVLESPADETYRSALGQWGMGLRDGPLEWTTPPAQSLRDDKAGATDDAAHPVDLAADELRTGQVSYGSDTDYYRVAVPAGHHSLQLTVGAPTSVGAALRLWAPDGVEVPMIFSPDEASGSIVYAANVEPETDYLVEVSQPRSSIVVSFDSSASVATQLAAIESGLRTLAEGMDADREALRIVPFDNEPLLPDWSSDPYEIAAAVQRFRLGESSSAVETSLRQAALDLATREGGRAVLLITDGASSSFADSDRLWGALSSSRPRVFTLAVGGEGEVPAIVRHNLMADWAVGTGGVATAARGGIEVMQAFDRLASWLRRPVAYTLGVESFEEELPPPAPGRISVLAPEIDGRRPAVLARDAAIELVVDISGSMREPLGDRSRIDIAREVLTGLVSDDIPAGATVALRRFPAPSDSCGSQLLVPLAPLDPVSMKATIAGLEVPRKARTPLALAIAAVGDDLADVAGYRTVVVVSDGNESCKGDPRAEVARLRERGIDITVNVVGLALDRGSRKSIARLAQVGGGSYFDATDAETLGAALRAAVSAPYEVLDAAGTVAGRGSVGGAPVELPTGRYEVRVLTDPPVSFRDVYLGPDAEVSLTLPRQALAGSAPR